MRNVSRPIMTFLIVLFTGSCSVVEENSGISGEPIRMESCAEFSAGIETRAAEGFPNNGSIGVIASTTYDPDYPQLNWNYSDISNAEAIASSVSEGNYSFTWTNQKYWPFDGSNLYFMAYSPIANGSLRFYVLSDDRSSLSISLDPNMPDILYASGNMNPQPFNKTNGTATLGEFRHVLSRLTVRVAADPDMSPNIEINSLLVRTKSRSAFFHLYRGDDGLTVETEQEDYVATLVSGNTNFKNQPFSSTIFLFPQTQDDVEISLVLIDTSTTVPYSVNYMVSFFTNTEGNPVTLERAQNTVLTINVMNVSVQDPDRNIRLEGAITDWDYRGDFGIAIN